MKKFINVSQIKTERESQRQNPVIYSLLGVLIGELDRLPIPRSQEPSEDQIYAIVKKLYEGAEYLSERDLSEEAKIEYVYLKDYIKVQLTEDEIRYKVKELASYDSTKNIGVIMKYFKEYYAGQYDGKLVSQIAKEILS